LTSRDPGVLLHQTGEQTRAVWGAGSFLRPFDERPLTGLALVGCSERRAFERPEVSSRLPEQVLPSKSAAADSVFPQGVLLMMLGPIPHERLPNPPTPAGHRSTPLARPRARMERKTPSDLGRPRPPPPLGAGEGVRASARSARPPHVGGSSRLAIARPPGPRALPIACSRARIALVGILIINYARSGNENRPGIASGRIWVRVYGMTYSAE
jgi:hypothetical protein